MTQTTGKSTYVAPAVFAKANGIKFKVGEVYDLPAMGHGEHETYGPIPQFKVTRIKDDGSFSMGTFTCIGIAEKAITCNTEVEVGAGDLFQKRRCETHQKKYARMKARPGLSEEERRSREATREQDKLAREEKRASEKAAKAAERVKAEMERMDKKKADIEARKAKAKEDADKKAKELELAKAAKAAAAAASKNKGTSAAA